MFRYIFLIILFHSILMEHHSVELFDRLHHLIEYVRNHTESQKPDLMLGFYLCEGNSKRIKWHLVINFIVECSFFHMFCSSTEDNAFVWKWSPQRAKESGGKHKNGTWTVWKSSGRAINMESERAQFNWYVIKIFHLSKQPTINRVLLAFFPVSLYHTHAVVQHLLKLSFWVTSLQNNEFMFFGNLTTHYPLSITLENFAGLIDNGAPSPSESGLSFHKLTQFGCVNN